MEYGRYLSEVIPSKDSLKLVQEEAKKYQEAHTAEECLTTALTLYQSDNFQIQEVGVLLCGYSGKERPEAIGFLKNTVSKHESWKVQEILAMAFDIHCRTIGYENALPLIHEWFACSDANVRRSVSEGLRIWTNRPYFKSHAEEAIRLLAAQRYDPSEYCRKSIGNALRDISKKFPQLIRSELESWDISSREIRQVSLLAGRFV